MNAEKLREDLVYLVGYLLTSAYGLYDEPAHYGPLRLVDAAGRLLDTLEAAGWSEPVLTELRQSIDAHRFGRSDQEALHAFLNEACLHLAAKFRDESSVDKSGR